MSLVGAYGKDNKDYIIDTADKPDDMFITDFIERAVELGFGKETVVKNEADYPPKEKSVSELLDALKEGRHE
jgi:hypothetical protein